MVVQSPRKRDLAVNFEIESVHGTSYLLERKDQVEYLGMLLDDTVSFKVAPYSFNSMYTRKRVKN